MRIRKNAKLVVERSKRRGSASFLICQLNRSSYDVSDSFFSQQDELGNDLPLNGCLSGCDNLAVGSVLSGESMELSLEQKTTPTQSEQDNKSSGIGGEVEESGDLLQSCSYVGQPKRSRTLIHRLPRSFSAPLPQIPLTTLPKKRGRPRKPISAVAAAAENPYEFYYYSGFGPSWRNSRRNGKNNASTSDCVVYVENANVDGDVDDYYNGEDWDLDSSSDSHESMSKVGDEHNDSDNGRCGGKRDEDVRKNKNGIERVVGEELDYIYDDEEEELYGGAAARKPIKARSLKSLM